jgi:hypothetical protein
MAEAAKLTVSIAGVDYDGTRAVLTAASTARKICAAKWPAFPTARSPRRYGFAEFCTTSAESAPPM